MFKNWWRRFRIKRGILKWVHLKKSDGKIKIGKGRGALALRRTKYVFSDGTVRHDLTIRVISIDCNVFNREYVGITAAQYRSIIKITRKCFDPLRDLQVFVSKTHERQYKQPTHSELWRCSGSRYKGPYWELRSWELNGNTYSLNTSESQDVNKLLGLAPHIGVGTEIRFGEHVIPKTAEDIMMFILTSGETLASRY